MPIKGNTSQFERAPAGNFIARCYAVIELGTQTHVSQQWGQRSKFDMRISFELPTVKMTGKFNPEVQGKPFTVHWTGTKSLHEKSMLRPLLAGWRGRDFTEEELKAGFDEQKLIGKPCRLTLIQNGEYTNIASISPLSQKLDANNNPVVVKGKPVFEECPKQVNESKYVSLDPDRFEPEMLDGLHEKTVEKINASPEFQALVSGAPPDNQEPPDQGDGSPPEGDDVPF